MSLVAALSVTACMELSGCWRLCGTSIFVSVSPGFLHVPLIGECGLAVAAFSV